jgi:hypothetical protein
MKQQKNSINDPSGQRLTTGQNKDAETDAAVSHTPGPWELRHFEDDWGYASVVAPIRDGESYLIARPGHPVLETHEANARLIAAAPEIAAENKRLHNQLKKARSAAAVQVEETNRLHNIINELLAACEQMLEEWDKDTYLEEKTIMAARNAIANAEGPEVEE